VLAEAHAEDLAAGDRGRAVAAAQPAGLPRQRRAALGPVLEQPRLARDGGAVGALPLRPVEGQGGGREPADRQTRKAALEHETTPDKEGRQAGSVVGED